MNESSLRALRASLLLTLGLGACVDGGGKAGSCEASTPILDASGAATGYERCADGTIHRVSAVAVSAEIPGESCRGDEAWLSCTTDADCEAAGTPHSVARCLHDDYVELGGRRVPESLPDSGAVGEDGCGCAFSCATDADCGEGYACVPVDVVTKDEAWSTCVSAECRTDEDCASGECGITSYDNGCGYAEALACREDTDLCRTDEDCAAGTCAPAYGEPVYDCQTTDCVIGRPLSVGGEARVAEAAGRADWLAELALEAGALDEPTRALLADHWRRIAALEHASVGSFARFTLELLALGAPPELLLAAQRAGADEVEHARLAYGLASACAGRAIGPGPLSLEGVRPALDPAAILEALVAEACVGETLGAVEARAAAEQVRAPALRAALLRIAEDEERHAALGWRTLRWMLDERPELAERASRAFARATARLRALPPGPAAPAHGLLGPDARERLYDAAIREVVTPCAAAVTSTAARATA